MTLYFIFLFLVPFQEHPILGAQLFHVGQFPITPIKVVGILLVAATILLPRPRDAAPTAGRGNSFAVCGVRDVSGSRDYPVVA